jgi:hypothetical protein
MILRLIMHCILLLCLCSCTRDSFAPEGVTSDEELYGLAKDSALHYYKNDTNTLGPAGNSPHGTFKVKFNSVAKAALDSTGELPIGSTFPENSLIVKFATSGHIAVMYKRPASPHAANNWLWSEYDNSGSTIVSVYKSGTSCTSCHSGSGHRDYVRLFDLH